MKIGLTYFRNSIKLTVSVIFLCIVTFVNPIPSYAASSVDEIYATVLEKYPDEVQLLDEKGAKKDNLLHFISDLENRLSKHPMVSKDNFERLVGNEFINMYWGKEHALVFNAVFNGWNISFSDLYNAYNTGGTKGVLDLLPDSIGEIGSLVRVNMLPETTDSIAVIAGNLKLFPGSKTNYYSPNNVKQDVINTTYNNMIVTVLGSNCQKLEFKGTDFLIPDENGNLGILDENLNMQGRFQIILDDFNYNLITFSGDGYLATTSNINLFGGQSIKFNEALILPGDINGDSRINVFDFTSWLNKYKQFLKGELDSSEIHKYDLTKNNKIDIYDFQLWLDSYKKVLAQ